MGSDWNCLTVIGSHKKCFYGKIRKDVKMCVCILFLSVALKRDYVLTISFGDLMVW